MLSYKIRSYANSSGLHAAEISGLSLSIFHYNVDGRFNKIGTFSVDDFFFLRKPCIGLDFHSIDIY